VRLAFLMELILGTAVGLGVFRDRILLHATIDFGFPIESPGWVRWLGTLGESVFEGVGLVVGIGTWVEAARRRAPQTWGPGRWVWSVVAASIIPSSAYVLVTGHWADFPQFRGMRLSAYPPIVLHQVRFFATVPWFLVALAFTRWLARTGRTPATDGRERAGRAYAVLLVAVAVVVTVLLAVGFDPGVSYMLIY
jgi:hypothetical protein